MTSSDPPSSGRRYAGKDARQRHAERYRQLIAAGIEVIGTRGYQASSVKAVCLEAGLTERYFYQCFDNREGLLAAVYEHLNEVVRARTLEALAEVPNEPVAMARAGAEAYFRLLRDDPRVARILLFEAVGVSSTMARLNRAAEAQYVALIGEIGRRHNRTPKLSPERQTLVAAGLVGASVNMGMRWVLEDYRQPLEDVVESLVLIHEAISRHLAG